MKVAALDCEHQAAASAECKSHPTEHAAADENNRADGQPSRSNTCEHTHGHSRGCWRKRRAWWARALSAMFAAAACASRALAGRLVGNTSASASPENLHSNYFGNPSCHFIFQSSRLAA